MKKNRIMSVKTQVFLSKTIVGIGWIAAGVFGFVDALLGDVMQVFFLLAAIIPMILLWRLKKEAGDEMSDENYVQAKAKAGDIMQMVLCLCTIVTPIISKLAAADCWDWAEIMMWSFFILIGVQNLITGFIFNKLEA